MRCTIVGFVLLTQAVPVFATNDKDLEVEINDLKKQAQLIQIKLNLLEKKIHQKHAVAHRHNKKHPFVKHIVKSNSLVTPAPTELKPAQSVNQAHQKKTYTTSTLLVRYPSHYPESLDFHPSVLMAKEHVVTYIAGTPVVASPYLGSRPAFDGSDYIVNISSINSDIRLMQQRRRLYQAYKNIAEPAPDVPIIALSGKLEPVANYTKGFGSRGSGDINLGSSELDVAAILSPNVEGYIGIGYDDAPSEWGGPRVDNAAFSLTSGFVNIGNLDVTPWYFTAGQITVPFGKFSSSMVSTPLPSIVGKTKARPFLLGYKSQDSSGPYAAVYAFRSTTDIGGDADEGANLGYIIDSTHMMADFGVSWINALDESFGMQINGVPRGFFGGFGSWMNGSEAIENVPGFDAHLNLSIERFNFAVEWLTATRTFRSQDLSFNGLGAKPSAGQTEASVTFMAFDKPASFGVGYQWTREALALNVPKQRISAVFNISIWKSTVESLEYRHDIDYGRYQFANGASPPGVQNLNILGTGRALDSVVAQIGIYF